MQSHAYNYKYTTLDILHVVYKECMMATRVPNPIIHEKKGY